MNLSSAIMRKSAALALMALACASGALAQAVIFPQARQAGQARASETDGTYVLANDLLTATFTSGADGSLVFGGCPEMNLLPGTELFTVTLGDGTEVPASEFTMSNPRITPLYGDANAIKGALRLDGQAIEADFTKGALTVNWRVVLRDGSHYLRTELDVTASADTPMMYITPMTYSVDTSNGVDAPVVVGNTRGAILASSRIFAGVESPMGINSAGVAIEQFNYNAWTPESFNWSPMSETPKGILDLNFSVTDIVGAKGYLAFTSPGENTVTFKYTGGTHRLNMVGVDVVDVKSGTVVAADYHVGYTGDNQGNSTYTLNIPAEGAYLVRYFMETKTETITSSGTITYSKPVVIPDVIIGEPEDDTKTALTPVRRVIAENASLAPGTELTDEWNTSMWVQVPQDKVPYRVAELDHNYPHVKAITRPVDMPSSGRLTATFVYKKGNNRLDIVGVDILDADGNVVANDYHFGYSGTNKVDNVYKVDVPYAGKFTLRYLCSNKNEANTSGGEIKLTFGKTYKLYIPADPATPITGTWHRQVTLAAGQSWSIGAVVGIVAPGQARRSVLAYSERERAVPWRPFPMYNSWYELNIDRNNDRNYTTNFNINQCVDVLNQWKENLYDKYDAHIQSYVWDDGWDEYGTWNFNPNFPNGFKEADEVASSMGASIGAWLGPVGGYGTSGSYRRNYWNGKGGMQLSNPAYNEVFFNATSRMLKDYNFNYFKFDGLSRQSTAYGPDPGITGEENIEGIIDVIMRLREIKPDVFFNTTVGTWASPFWFQYSDAIWRQEGDHGTIGNQGNDRERWITYRDRLVYDLYVKKSPLCPINSMMTHGIIITSHGQVSKDMSYASALNEVRCAFACGSSQVEVYCDYKLLNSIEGGKLWGDIAECIKWQERNADVLPDAHWVGGNPWNGSKCEVYGWASWNGPKATLAIRNGQAAEQTFNFTLREALEIPEYINDEFILTPSFQVQDALQGLTEGEPVNIDTPLSVKLPANSVFVFDGKSKSQYGGIESVTATVEEPASGVKGTFDLQGRRVLNPSKGLYIVNGRKVILK